MKPIIGWFANNHVAANLLMGLVLMAGIISLPQMPRKSFPDIDIPVINVNVPYLGAAPEEAEQGVCIRIEEELEGIEGVKEIRSNAMEGMCSVSVELYEDADESKALDDVKNRVDAIDTFPDETEKPIVNLVTPQRSVLSLAITGPQDERALKELASQIRDDLVQIPGLTQADLQNTRAYELSIEVSEASLRRNGLTFDEVAGAVRRGSLDLPGGSIKTDAGEILLRTKGQAYVGEEFEQLVVTTRSDGTRVYLKDVANIDDGFADTDQGLEFNGKPAALIRVGRIGKQDIQQLANGVKNFIVEERDRYPEGTELTVWNDDSEMLESRLDTLLDSGRQGFLMVLLVLALFLRPRLAFWVSVGVPVAFMGAIALVHTIGISLNSISLFGFILVLGILVDDAIVVGESVHSEHQRNVGQLTGARQGAQRVTIPVTFGVLTTVAAFLPLIFGVGFMGQVMGVIASTVICCLVFSLIESQMILPSHLGHSKVETPTAEVGLMLLPIIGILLLGFATDLRTYIAYAVAVVSIYVALRVAGLFERIAIAILNFQRKFAVGLESFIDTNFRLGVIKAMANRYITAAIAFVALLSAVAILVSGRLPFSFFPPLASDQVIAKLTMPLGTSAQVTQAAIDQLSNSAAELKKQLNEQYVLEQPAIHIMAALGDHPSAGSGPPSTDAGTPSSAANSHLGEVVMQLSPSEQRTLNTRQIADRWRTLNGPITDAVELKFNSSLFSAGNDIDLQLEGDNVDDLRIIAEQLRMKLAEYPGVLDITDSFRSGKQELKLDILPAGEALGLSLSDLARQVRQAFYGEEAQRIQRGRDDVRVMVRYTKDERRTLSALDGMRIRTPQGSEVPFSTVAVAKLGRGYSTIRRSDGRRVVNVVADVDRTQITANEVIADLRGGPIQSIMAPYPRVSYSLEGAQADQSESVAALGPMYMVALFGIFALLAIPLKSYGLPLIIMSVIPFAFTGAIWGHLIMKSFGLVSGLAMMSVLGVTAASGVVVNSSLVLVHRINELRASGEELISAVVSASVSRCRPILLTSVTTFVGLSPLMLNQSVQAQFMVPMAISLAFGVMFATAVTLLVVPAGYLILDDIGRWFGASEPSEAEETISPAT